MRELLIWGGRVWASPQMAWYFSRMKPLQIVVSDTPIRNGGLHHFLWNFCLSGVGESIHDFAIHHKKSAISLSLHLR